MNRIVNRIQIEGFKSLENTTLEECRTFNLLLGRPNVGKSNILEALSLFAVPYLTLEKREIGELLRCRNGVNELFYNGDLSHPIRIQAGSQQVSLKNIDGGKFYWTNYPESLTISGGKIQGKKTLSDSYPVFKRYTFRRLDRFTNVDLPFLLPVGGENIMQIIQQDADLTHELSELAKDYELQLLFDTSTREIKFQKRLSENTVFSIPFFSISDTLQRLIFYKAAICGNTDSVILLEEIEAHAYPPYISKITGSILENPNNQYFITTHSPYVVNDFLEQEKEELAIYLVDWQKGHTVVRKLSETEMEEVYNDGIDLFFNSCKYYSCSING